MRLWLISSQAATFGAWVYCRWVAAPLDRFMVGNFVILAHLIVIIGLLGPRVLHAAVLALLMVAAIPVLYNVARYYPENKRHSTLPWEAWRDARATASRFNQHVVDIVAAAGALAVFAFTLTLPNPPFSRWVVLALMPGLTALLTIPAEEFHRRRRLRG